MGVAADILRKAKELFEARTNLSMSEAVSIADDTSDLRLSARVYLREALYETGAEALAEMSRQEKCSRFDRAIALAEAGKS